MWPGLGGVELGTGAMIVEVVPDSPADQAGLSEGDLLLTLEGKEIDAENDLAALIAAYKPGDKVTIEVAELGPRIGRESREVTVTLAEHPEAEGKAYLGVTFVPLSSDEFGPHGRMYWFHEFGDDEDERRAPRFEFRLPRR
jgi:predicted metalloprotease with PDZ domain